MGRVKTIRVYNLVNTNGERLQLHFGYTVNDYGPAGDKNAGWRWSFEGKNIPMPVRSRTWFCGFPEDTMISWLKGNGWYPQTRVDMGCGYAKVYELPDADDKGNEESANDWGCPIHSKLEKHHFDDAIYFLANNGKRSMAVRTYLYAHGGHLRDAVNAVREIVDRQE